IATVLAVLLETRPRLARSHLPADATYNPTLAGHRITLHAVLFWIALALSQALLPPPDPARSPAPSAYILSAAIWITLTLAAAGFRIRHARRTMTDLGFIRPSPLSLLTAVVTACLLIAAVPLVVAVY